MELKMRNSLQEVYFGKTRDIVNGLRSVDSLIESRKQAEIQKELVSRLARREKDSNKSAAAAKPNKSDT